MKTVVIGLLSLILSATSLQVMAKKSFVCWKTDEDLVHFVMLEARSEYHGFCYCPEDLDGLGNYCDDKSALRNPLGHVALCYPEDVTPAMIVDYRDKYCSEIYKLNTLSS